MRPPHARLRLTRSGGFTGIAVEATIDTVEIDPREAESILAALGAVDLNSLSARPLAPPGPPDTFGYALEVERGSLRYRIEFTESDTPDVLRPVLDALVKRDRSVGRFDTG